MIPLYINPPPVKLRYSKSPSPLNIVEIPGVVRRRLWDNRPPPPPIVQKISQAKADKLKKRVLAHLPKALELMERSAEVQSSDSAPSSAEPPVKKRRQRKTQSLEKPAEARRKENSPDEYVDVEHCEDVVMPVVNCPRSPSVEEIFPESSPGSSNSLVSPVQNDGQFKTPTSRRRRQQKTTQAAEPARHVPTNDSLRRSARDTSCEIIFEKAVSGKAVAKEPTHIVMDMDFCNIDHCEEVVTSVPAVDIVHGDTDATSEDLEVIELIPDDLRDSNVVDDAAPIPSSEASTSASRPSRQAKTDAVTKITTPSKRRTSDYVEQTQNGIQKVPEIVVIEETPKKLAKVINVLPTPDDRLVSDVAEDTAAKRTVVLDAASKPSSQPSTSTSRPSRQAKTDAVTKITSPLKNRKSDHVQPIANGIQKLEDVGMEKTPKKLSKIDVQQIPNDQPCLKSSTSASRPSRQAKTDAVTKITSPSKRRTGDHVQPIANGIQKNPEDVVIGKSKSAILNHSNKMVPPETRKRTAPIHLASYDLEAAVHEDTVMSTSETSASEAAGNSPNIPEASKTNAESPKLPKVISGGELVSEVLEAHESSPIADKRHRSPIALVRINRPHVKYREFHIPGQGTYDHPFNKAYIVRGGEDIPKGHPDAMKTPESPESMEVPRNNSAHEVEIVQPPEVGMATVYEVLEESPSRTSRPLARSRRSGQFPSAGSGRPPSTATISHYETLEKARDSSANPVDFGTNGDDGDDEVFEALKVPRQGPIFAIPKSRTPRKHEDRERPRGHDVVDTPSRPSTSSSAGRHEQEMDDDEPTTSSAGGGGASGFAASFKTPKIKKPKRVAISSSSPRPQRRCVTAGKPSKKPTRKSTGNISMMARNDETSQSSTRRSQRIPRPKTSSALLSPSPVHGKRKRRSARGGAPEDPAPAVGTVVIDADADADAEEDESDETATQLPRTVRHSFITALRLSGQKNKNMLDPFLVITPEFQAFLDQSATNISTPIEDCMKALKQEHEHLEQLYQTAERVHNFRYPIEYHAIAWNPEPMSREQRALRLSRYERKNLYVASKWVGEQYETMRDRRMCVNLTDPLKMVAEQLFVCETWMHSLEDGFFPHIVISLGDIIERKETNQYLFEQALATFPADLDALKKPLDDSPTNRTNLRKYIRQHLRYDPNEFMEMLDRMIRSEHMSMPQGLYLQRALLNVANHWHYYCLDNGGFEWFVDKFTPQSITKGLEFNREGEIITL